MQQFILPIAKRRIIDDSFYIKSKKTAVKIVIGAPEDEQVVLDFLASVYSAQEPINVGAGITPDESKKRNLLRVRNGLKDGRILLALDCFEVVGIVSGVLVEKQCDNGNDIDLDFKNRDFGKELDSWPDESLAIRKCELITHEAIKVLMSFWPKDCKKMMRIGALAVKQEYQGGGLASRLWLECMRLANEHGLKFVDSICAAKASTAIALKLGMKVVYTLKHGDFLAHGKRVFNHLCDGTDEENLVIGDLDKILNKLDNEWNKPQLPDAYLVNQSIEHEVLAEVSLPKFERNAKFVIAKIEDAEVVLHYLHQEFYKQAPMAKTMQCSNEEISELVGRFKNDVFKQHLTVLALDNGRICGVAFNKAVEIDDEKRNAELNATKEDFTNEVDQTPGSTLKLRQIVGFISWVDQFIYQHIPTDCNKVFALEKLSVHPSYKGCKIGHRLWEESMKLAQKNGFKCVLALCNAVGSNAIATQLRMQQKFSFSYNNFKYHNQIVISNGRLHDQGSEINWYIKEL